MAEIGESGFIKIPNKGNNKRIVVVGGGFGGIEFLKHIPSKGFQIVLLDKNNFHTFIPLLYQVATAGLEPDSIAEPLRKLFKKKKNFIFRMAEAQKVDTDNNLLHTDIGKINYDELILANGSINNYFGNEKVRRNSFPLKEVGHALNLRSQILQMFEQSVLLEDNEEKEARMHFVVVGGGPSGVEVAGALGELKKHILPNDYPDLNFDDMKITLVEGLPKLLPAMSEESSRESKKFLEKLGVHIRLEALVKDYDGHKAELSDESELKCKTLVWAAGVKGNALDGIPKDSIEKSRLLVNCQNGVKGCPHVYAIGDLACMKSEQLPKGHPMLAPVAKQQGEHLANNFNREANGKASKPFKYKDLGTMATIGRNKAVVDLKILKTQGRFAWYIWMFVHLVLLSGFRNRMITLANWVWNYFTYDKGTRLIVRKVAKDEIKNENPEKQEEPALQH